METLANFFPGLLPTQGAAKASPFYSRERRAASFVFLVNWPLAPTALPFVREKAQIVFFHIVAMSLKLGTKVLELGPV